MATGDKIFIADKPTLDETKTNTESINTKVGTNTDQAGTTSLFARLKQIYDYLTTTIVNKLDVNTSTRQADWGATTTHRDRIDTTISSRAAQTTVNTINSNVGSNSDLSSATGSVHAKLKELRSQVINSGGGIKSVQRGIAVIRDSDNTVDITISTVNMNKSYVNLNMTAVGTGGPSSSHIFPAINIQLASSTQVRFSECRLGSSSSSGNSFNVSWEVIEFE